jgi:uncharacterized protein YbjT (DUF2867 family)
VPAGFKLQSVDMAEVAKRLIRSLKQGPSSAICEFAGPEVLSVGEMARSWAAAKKLRRSILRIPLPGTLAEAFRVGENIAHNAERGVVRWAEWLASVKNDISTADPLNPKDSRQNFR